MPDIVLRDPSDWTKVNHGMQQVMHGARGTARKAAIGAQYRIAGKSGTAQVVAIKQGEKYDRSKVQERHRDHALFVGFAPADNPKIVVSVMVENGESGSGVAAPVVRQVMDAWLLDQDGRLKPNTPALSARRLRPVMNNFDRMLSSEDVMRRRATLLQRCTSMARC
jgi:penicillin-binding protein 2